MDNIIDNKDFIDSMMKLLVIAHMKGQIYAGLMPSEEGAKREILQMSSDAMKTKEETLDRSIRTECYSCINKEEVPGNAHIKCTDPDPAMDGNAHGKAKGWFIYPILFDPSWKIKLCNNYKKK